MLTLIQYIVIILNEIFRTNSILLIKMIIYDSGTGYLQELNMKNIMETNQYTQENTLFKVKYFIFIYSGSGYRSNMHFKKKLIFLFNVLFQMIMVDFLHG